MFISGKFWLVFCLFWISQSFSVANGHRPTTTVIDTTPRIRLEKLDYNNRNGYLRLSLDKNSGNVGPMLDGSGKVVRIRSSQIEGEMSTEGSAMANLEVHMKVKCIGKISFKSFHPGSEFWAEEEVVVKNTAKWTSVSMIPDVSNGRPVEFFFTLQKAKGCKKMKVKKLHASAFSGTI